MSQKKFTADRDNQQIIVGNTVIAGADNGLLNFSD